MTCYTHHRYIDVLGHVRVDAQSDHSAPWMIYYILIKGIWTFSTIQMLMYCQRTLSN